MTDYSDAYNVHQHVQRMEIQTTMRQHQIDKLHARLKIAIDALTEIATAETGATNDLEHEQLHDLIDTAADALHKIKVSP